MDQRHPLSLVNSISIAFGLVCLSFTLGFGAITIAPAPTKVELYGFLKLDAFYDNSEVYQGDWLLFARPGATPQAKTKVFSMNARASRLGLRFTRPQLNANTNLNALLEMDFSGGFPNSATAARQPQVRLRHAWMELEHKVWELRLGQDWGLIVGPFPYTTEALVGAARGNLWMAFAQVKFSLKLQPFKVAFSVNRPTSGNVKYNSYENGDLDIVDDGERSGLPWFMGRVWYTTPKLTLSLSSHYGQEKIADLSAAYHKVTSYSYNADLIFNLGKLNLTAKVFRGSNLNTFFGGIVQGYVAKAAGITSIPAQGGWGQISYSLKPQLIATVGLGIDDPDDSKLPTGYRAHNLFQYVNLTYKPVTDLAFMFEVNHLTTEYIDRPTGRNLRLQFTSTYQF